MKKLLLLFIALISLQSAKAQLGVISGDSTDLETNLSLISMDSASGNTWQIGLPEKAFFGTSYSVPHSIMTDSINPYPTDNLSRFTVAFIDSTIVRSIELGFWHKYESDSSKDGGYVEISVDSGATWENVATQHISFLYHSTNFYYDLDTIKGNIPAFTGTQDTWQYSSYYFQFLIPVLRTIDNDENLPAVRGGGEVITQKVMFRFNFQSDNIETNKAGWIIDNISLKQYDVGGGINENKMANFDVQLFPNPIVEQGIIQVVPENNERGFTIAIYNNMGELVTKSPVDKNNQYIINGNELTSGIYFYSVFSKTGGIRNGKLIIK